jgi:hypothetical protein
MDQPTRDLLDAIRAALEVTMEAGWERARVLAALDFTLDGGDPTVPARDLRALVERKREEEVS